MEPHQRNLYRLFNTDIQYRIPLYQRPYVWNAEHQWTPLWEDIERLYHARRRGDEPRSHFMGAVVLEPEPAVTGGVSATLVIDGQQRLTTTSILLQCCARVAEELDVKRYAQRFRNLVENREEERDSDGERWKVLPTNVDRSVFEFAATADSSEMLASAVADESIGGAIAEGFVFFSQAIHTLVADQTKEDDLNASEVFEHLFGAITKDLSVVTIDLRDGDDAQSIFETLNARGTPLLPADLIKNHILHRTRQAKLDVDALYHAHWKRFDDEHEFWREEISVGRQKRARIDNFMKHWLTLALDDDVTFGRLYDGFKRYSENAGSPEFVAAEMTVYADIFKEFENAAHGRARVFFHRLRELQTTSVYPLLFATRRALPDNDEFAEFLVVVESYLIRRMICRLTAKGYNRVLFDAVKYCKARGFGASVLAEFLSTRKGDSSVWPDDGWFQWSWQTDRAYTRIKRSRVVMVLQAVGSQVAAGSRYGADVVSVQSGHTVEHLMPVSWQEHWPLAEEIDDVEAATTRRNDLLHTWGNLSLLTGGLNASVSNGPWPAKRDGILMHSGFSLNRALLKHDTWDEAAIESRSGVLFEAARRIWPGPIPQDEAEAASGPDENASAGSGAPT